MSNLLSIVIGAYFGVMLVKSEVASWFRIQKMFRFEEAHMFLIIGGILFGVGWSITGACPGPIYAQIGSGEHFALITFAGVLLGAFLYSWLRPRLPH
tara:strand:- start:635 stop:925 length:291 start_codon:yes stop_codon:yes gene_type:complete